MFPCIPYKLTLRSPAMRVAQNQTVHEPLVPGEAVLLYPLFLFAE